MSSIFKLNHATVLIAWYFIKKVLHFHGKNKSEFHICMSDASIKERKCQPSKSLCNQSFRIHEKKKREFKLLTMKESENIYNFLGWTLAVVNKMKSNGSITEQSIVVSKIQQSLTTKFNYVVCAIEESNDFSALSIDELHEKTDPRIPRKETRWHLQSVSSKDGTRACHS